MRSDKKNSQAPTRSQESHYLSDIVFISAVEAFHIYRALGTVLEGRALLLRCAEAVGVVVGSATFKEKQRRS